MNEQLLQLKRELEELKQSANAQIVKTALESLQSLNAKPAELFDPYASLAALEHLVTVTKEKNDPESDKYSIILRQCRSLVGNKALQSVLLKLVASKQEADVARVIEKVMKAANQPKYGREPGRVRTSPYPRGYKGRRIFNAKCLCGRFGHMARFCPLAQSSPGSSVKRENVA